MLRKSFPFPDTSPKALSARAVVQGLCERGFTAYLAGGAVRDLLLGRSPKDFDVVTDARPQEVLKIFRRTRKVGIAFGVVLVQDFGDSTEVATFRTDGTYSDGRRPDSVSFTDPASDALRRDFTVNGLFYDIATGEVVDHVGGLEDLQRHRIRAIGHPQDRFGEDYLRILRALRFALQLGFEIEEETWIAARNLAGKIRDLAPERVHAELVMIFAQGCSDRALALLMESTLAEELLPAPFDSGKLRLGGAHEEGGDFCAALAALLAASAITPGGEEKFLLDLRCTRTEIKAISGLLRESEALRGYGTLPLCRRKRLLRAHEGPRLLFYASRTRMDDSVPGELRGDLAAWTEQSLRPQPLIRGEDLAARGFPRSSKMATCLSHIEDLQLEGKIQSAEEAWAALLAHPEFGPLLT
ncbi:MAG: CCA tRNA nucleotidyltransferase [Planctomycetes bacterium]|nr:CCA tRNA nucleotidyltransferase [Planctomycetota bacterium]